MYKFKEIQTVPNAEAFIDLSLSRTQRKTPTVVHPGYKITRIRKFYERKIKYAQSTFTEKIQFIVQGDSANGKPGFPKIDDIHPFYADLCNCLYDRDHFKLALGQMNKCKNMIDNIAKDYVRMMKFADSLYRCKMLKRASLGRMCTAVKKLGPTLKYLEEVRQHLGRLPSINPSTRTIIMTGFPNVGKSSFMNLVTQADVDVQPYAFTTCSLFLGHMDYKYSKWQVIDTPGILDHSLEERNTIEMTAITALAHIPATILFILDISESCGFTLKQQCSLFESLKPLFKNKPLLVIVNKTDLRKMEALTEEEKSLIDGVMADVTNAESGRKIEMMEMSCATKEGVDCVRAKACELLLTQRVDNKVKQNRSENIKNRIHIAAPTTVRTINGGAVKVENNGSGSSSSSNQVASMIRQERPAMIPESVLKMRAALEQEESKLNEDKLKSDLERKEAIKEKKEELQKQICEENEVDIELEKDLMEELGGAGVYRVDQNKSFMLADDEWKYDSLPEFMDGHNVADFVDPDILEKLKALDADEENELAAEGLLEADENLAQWNETKKELDQVHGAIRYKQMEKHCKKAKNTMGQGGTERKSVKSISEVTENLKDITRRNTKGKLEVNEESLKKRADTARGRSLTSRKRKREDTSVDGMRTASRSKSRVSQLDRASSSIRGHSISISRSRVASSLRNPEDQERAEKKRRKLSKKVEKDSRKGEADRHVPDLKPKHLFSGKRGFQADRR